MATLDGISFALLPALRLYRAQSFARHGLLLGSKLPWDEPRSDGLQYETAPSLAELIAILHGQGQQGQRSSRPEHRGTIAGRSN